MTDEELFGTGDLDGEDVELDEDYAELLTEEEKKQLETALKMESAEVDEDSFDDGKPHFENSNRVSWSPKDIDDAPRQSSASGLDLDPKNDKKGWFGWGRRSLKQEDPKKITPPRSSLCIDEKVSNLLGDDLKKSSRLQRGRRSVDARPSNARPSNFRAEEGYLFRKEKENKKLASKEPIRKRRVTPTNDGSGESEYKKGLRPVLWLTPNFPLKTEEMLPLLDILANKVKAIRRLRELLTTKLPAGTFPVKVAIPVVPTIRVIVTFTKFEEMRSNEEFTTPPSSPDSKGKDSEQHANSWFSWIKGSATKVAGMSGVSEEQLDEAPDPFAIPSDYVWTSMDAKKRKSREKKSKKKGKKMAQDNLELGLEV